MSRTLLLTALDGLGRRLRTAPQGDPEGVLFVRSGGLGDTVLFAHVFPYFKALARPGERITVLVRRDAVKTAFLLGSDVDVMTVDYGRFLASPGYRMRVSSDLRRRNFRMAVSTDERRHPMIDEVLIAATGAPERPAMRAMAWPKYDKRLAANRLFFTRLLEPGPERLHVVEKWTRLANWLTGADHAAPMARLPDDALPPPAELDAPTVVIQPFAAVPEKQVTAADVQRLIEAAPEGVETVITGAPADLDRAPGIAALTRRPHVRFEGGTFEEIVPLLRAARAVISVDTALMHLACAVGAPTLGIASAAWIGELVPYPATITPPNMEVLYHDMPCAGCAAACHLAPENGMYPCVARLDRDLVLAKFRALVQQ